MVPVAASKGRRLTRYLPRSRIASSRRANVRRRRLTDKPERFLAAEIIREKIFRLTGDELPYRAAVMIDKFEHEGNLRRIFAAILVDKGFAASDPHRRRRRSVESASAPRPVSICRSFWRSGLSGALCQKIKSGWSENAAVLRDLGIT